MVLAGVSTRKLQIRMLWLSSFSIRQFDWIGFLSIVCELSTKIATVRDPSECADASKVATRCRSDACGSYCHWWSAVYCHMNFQLSLKQRKQFSCCHRARSLARTPYLQRSIQQEVNQWLRNWSLLIFLLCFTACRGKRLSHKNSRMHPQSSAQDCDNHRCISLLSIAGKILEKLLPNRQNEDQAGILTESQCGFRKEWGTIDMIFTARQLQEKCQ